MKTQLPIKVGIMGKLKISRVYERKIKKLVASEVFK